MAKDFGFILPPDHISRHHFRDPLFRRIFFTSLILHAVLIALAGTFTLFRMPQSGYAPTYTVDLVSLPPSPAAARGGAKKPAAPAPKPVEKAAAVPVKPAVPREGQITVRTRGTAVGDESARAQRKKRLDELEREASRLYQTFRSEDTPESSVREEAGPVDPTTTGDAAVSEGAGEGLQDAVTGRGGAPVDLRFRGYYDMVWERIRASWILPDGVSAAEERLLTIVGIRIASTGEIVDHWVEKKSGNIYYDQSALRAISKASPLPPLPSELKDDYLEVGINFRVLE
ncbi:MAG: TonB C-terminal domain-containing protein [bacterium]|nr:MAG: TonB C-terminal domain-containing protein [bacterium]